MNGKTQQGMSTEAPAPLSEQSGDAQERPIHRDAFANAYGKLIRVAAQLVRGDLLPNLPEHKRVGPRKIAAEVERALEECRLAGIAVRDAADTFACVLLPGRDKRTTDDGFASAMMTTVAAMGASEAGLRLAAQLFGIAPCDGCGYRKLHCRCDISAFLCSPAVSSD